MDSNVEDGKDVDKENGKVLAKPLYVYFIRLFKNYDSYSFK